MSNDSVYTVRRSDLTSLRNASQKLHAAHSRGTDADAMIKATGEIEAAAKALKSGLLKVEKPVAEDRCAVRQKTFQTLPSHITTLKQSHDSSVRKSGGQDATSIGITKTMASVILGMIRAVLAEAERDDRKLRK